MKTKNDSPVIRMSKTLKNNTQTVPQVAPTRRSASPQPVSGREGGGGRGARNWRGDGAPGNSCAQIEHVEPPDWLMTCMLSQSEARFASLIALIKEGVGVCVRLISEFTKAFVLCGHPS